MAWLHNLAGKAEDLLNKIDKNAAQVLNETSVNINSVENSRFRQVTTDSEKEETVISLPLSLEVPLIPRCKSNASIKHDGIDYISAESEGLQTQDSEDNGLIINFTDSKIDQYEIPSNKICHIEENAIKTECTTNVSSKSSSLHNSFIFSEEAQNWEERVNSLEVENQELNKQLLNLRHLYSEIQNENTNLHFQVERANESVVAAQLEMEQYRARTQRILQEKEKLIGLEKSSNAEDVNENITTYIEQLKKELDFQTQRNRELSEKAVILSSELTTLQQDYVLLQKTNQETNHRLQESIKNERKFRMTAEDECRIKIKELQATRREVAQLAEQNAHRNNEISQLKDQLKQNISYKTNDNLESRVLNLTQTLLAKQNSLEMVTTEKNALRLQFEKLENEYQTLLQIQKAQIKFNNANETDDVKSQFPQLLVPSPLDVGVTRRVKHAYSTLDAISIRTGVFLRRYPSARVFVFSYMVLLHIWVLFILFTYIPSNR